MRFAATIILSLLVLGGIYGVFLYSGVIKIGIATPASSQQRMLRPEILALCSFRALPADTEMTRDLLLDRKTGLLLIRPVLLKAVEGKQVLTRSAQLFGRVLRHAKAAGEPFREEDFYPPGKGLNNWPAAPPEFISYTFLASRLKGSSKLKAGDHIDIVLPDADFTEVLVTDGIVITPPTRVQTVIGTDKSGQPMLNPIEQIEIAVRLSEVQGVITAVESGADLTSLGRFPQSAAGNKPGVATTQP